MDLFCLRLGQFLEPHNQKGVAPGEKPAKKKKYVAKEGEASDAAKDGNEQEASTKTLDMSRSDSTAQLVLSTSESTTSELGKTPDELRELVTSKEALWLSLRTLGGIACVVLMCLVGTLAVGALNGWSAAVSFTIPRTQWPLYYAIFGYGIFGVVAVTLSLIQPTLMVCFLFPFNVDVRRLVIGNGILTVITCLVYFAPDYLLNDPNGYSFYVSFLFLIAGAVFAAHTAGRAFHNVKRMIAAVSLSTIVIAVFLVLYRNSIVPFFITHPSEVDRSLLRLILHPLFWCLGLFVTRLATRYLPQPDDPHHELGLSKPYFALLLLPQFYSSFYGRLLTTAIDSIGTVVAITLVGAGFELILRLSVLKRDELFTRLVLGKKRTSDLFALSKPSAYMYMQFLYVEMVFEQGCIIVTACYAFFYKLFFVTVDTSHVNTATVIYTLLIQFIVELLLNFVSIFYAIRYMRLSLHKVLSSRPKYYFGYLAFVFLIGSIFVAGDAYAIFLKKDLSAPDS